MAGLVALALLGLGEAAPAAFPVQVSIEGHGGALLVSVDGQQHSVTSGLGPGWRGILLEQPGPLEREYQIDGSDTTATDDRQVSVIADALTWPLYRFDAWLRDESSYSRWEGAGLVDLTTGQPADIAKVLPNDFRLDVRLLRPEAVAHVWLIGPTDAQREGLELDRDRRNARWVIQRAGGADVLPRWFFPERSAPFAAELVHLTGRSVAAGYALMLAAVLVSRLLERLRLLSAWLSVRRAPAGEGGGQDELPDQGAVRAPTLPSPRLRARSPRWPGFSVLEMVMPLWLLAAALVTARLYHQMPHILDAVSYTFQAGLFVSGRIALDAGPLVGALHGPFEIVSNGRLFSQYPPGAPAAYALGQLVSLEWLVGPLACVAMIAATRWTAGVLFGGKTCGLLVVCLGALSPFVLFQAGSFLSHPIAGGVLACALAAFVAGERASELRWYALSGALLGAGFLTRETASVLFALPLAARLLVTRRWRPLVWMVACGLPGVVVYLIYNAQLTGSMMLLPRTMFDPSDHFGFGDGIGFHTRHTFAAGLANTDELLTLLQFDLFGWPPLFTLGLLCLPFLFGRAQAWDVLAACGFLAFVIAYTAYFYHGIALGPRYYFEAMPWLLLLGARGAQALADLARSRAAAGVVLVVLSLNTALFYLPAELLRRGDFSAMPGQRKVSLAFVQSGVFGPHLVGVPAPALVVTDDWWLYNASLAALNCPRVPDCEVLFALAGTANDLSTLRAQFPDRPILRTVDRAGQIELTPIAP
ncbi:MAG: ArnT family glycosyltransferase [Chloroflexota bacterium]